MRRDRFHPPKAAAARVREQQREIANPLYVFICVCVYARARVRVCVRHALHRTTTRDYARVDDDPETPSSLLINITIPERHRGRRRGWSALFFIRAVVFPRVDRLPRR